MAIKRQVENPGQSLMVDEPIKYSIKPSQKKLSLQRTNSKTTPVRSSADVRKDLLYTTIVFLAILGVLIAIYLKS